MVYPQLKRFVGLLIFTYVVPEKEQHVGEGPTCGRRRRNRKRKTWRRRKNERIIRRTWCRRRSPNTSLFLPSSDPSDTPLSSSASLMDTRIHTSTSFTTRSESLTSLATPEHKHTCKNKKCSYCPKLNTSGSITCHVTGQKFPARIKVSCRSNNLIYCISCNTCGKQYIGQTKRTLGLRMGEHFRHIKRSDPKQAVGLHFTSAGHNGLTDVTIHVLELIRTPPQSDRGTRVRLQVEKKWIHNMRCPAPLGLNIFD